jgi:hypothetical protein
LPLINRIYTFSNRLATVNLEKKPRKKARLVSFVGSAVLMEPGKRCGCSGFAEKQKGLSFSTQA